MVKKVDRPADVVEDKQDGESTKQVESAVEAGDKKKSEVEIDVPPAAADDTPVADKASDEVVSSQGASSGDTAEVCSDAGGGTGSNAKDEIDAEGIDKSTPGAESNSAEQKKTTAAQDLASNDSSDLKSPSKQLESKAQSDVEQDEREVSGERVETKSKSQSTRVVKMDTCTVTITEVDQNKQLEEASTQKITSPTKEAPHVAMEGLSPQPKQVKVDETTDTSDANQCVEEETKQDAADDESMQTSPPAPPIPPRLEDEPEPDQQSASTD